jgi:hypothetical protein
MKPFIFGSIVAAAIALAACSTTTNPNGGTTTTIDPAAVEAAAQLACGFAPLASDIVALETQNKNVLTQTQVVTLICNAVTATTATKTGASAPPSAVTVVVDGKSFVIHKDPAK